jgi:hypothetical protein
MSLVDASRSAWICIWISGIIGALIFVSNHTLFMLF